MLTCTNSLINPNKFDKHEYALTCGNFSTNTTQGLIFSSDIFFIYTLALGFFMVV